uniref:acylaminoacyl-peptidase n=1 Tax=Sphaeramia orbicularis TaxID=375764 RepID=A0A673AW13_9TELE
MDPRLVSGVYSRVSGLPAPVSAHVRQERTVEDRIYRVSTDWTQTDLVRGSRLTFSQQWTVITEEDHSIRTVLPPGPAVPGSGELLKRVSPLRGLKAVVRETGGHQLLEVWDDHGLRRCVDLSVLNKHGRVYDDAQFGCLSWSDCENKLLYVAEKKNVSSGPDGVCSCVCVLVQQDRSVYCEDWGEALSNHSLPVLCVVDLHSGDVSVLQGVPPDVSPGQALWAPGGQGLFFIGWYHEPFRLGLKFCSNRSPDGSTLVFLQGRVFGPHNQCLSIQQMDLQTGTLSTLVDVVHRPQDGGFAGVYEALPSCCWSTDAHRIVFSSACRNWKVTNTTCSVYGSWKLLTVQDDLMVVCCSSPNTPPTLVRTDPFNQLIRIRTDELFYLFAVLTPSSLQNGTAPRPDWSDWAWRCSWVRTVRSYVHVGAFGVRCVSVVILLLCVLVFTVNYRGSTGFGQDAILSLIGRIGTQDVKDVQRAVLTALQTDSTLDPERLAVLGGSHGGFLSCHLIGQYPEFYRACAARNPVINAATLLGTSDIVDWRYTSVGLEYSYDRTPTADALGAMLERSPITHAAQVRAAVLLMLGGRDRRVSPHQGLEFYRALKSRGSTVRLLWFPEDGHSLSRVDTQADCFINTALWLQEHL